MQHLAIVLGRTRITVQRWLRQYRQEGIIGMLREKKSPGRPGAIPNWAVERLGKNYKSRKDSKVMEKCALGCRRFWELKPLTKWYIAQYAINDNQN